jgi:hypothetical protein
MSAAHQRSRGLPSGSDLAMLREIFEDLPGRYYRWRTDQGRLFLLALADCESEHGAADCAHALGLTPAHVRALLRRQMPRHLTPYPDADELRPLARAWRAVEAADRQGRSVRRADEDYAAVHQALARLLNRYDLTVIASALKERPRRLERFTAPPIKTP